MEQQSPIKVELVKPFYKRFWVWVGGIIGLLILIGIFSGDNEKLTTQTQAPQSEQTNTEQPITTSTQKQYQKIFTFSGDGAKKSEPFTVQGDRFKIAYDCKGDANFTLCQAFVYKVGSSLPQGVMNTSKPTKDETIIYTSTAGRGEYYIDANVLGNFTMTVYDYK